MAGRCERVRETFRDVFAHSPLVLREPWTAADGDGWDSLRHINRTVALEKELRRPVAKTEILRRKQSGSEEGSLSALVQNKAGAAG